MSPENQSVFRLLKEGTYSLHNSYLICYYPGNLTQHKAQEQ